MKQSTLSTLKRKGKENMIKEYQVTTMISDCRNMSAMTSYFNCDVDDDTIMLYEPSESDTVGCIYGSSNNQDSSYYQAETNSNLTSEIIQVFHVYLGTHGKSLK